MAARGTVAASMQLFVNHAHALKCNKKSRAVYLTFEARLFRKMECRIRPRNRILRIPTVRRKELVQCGNPISFLESGYISAYSLNVPCDILALVRRRRVSEKEERQLPVLRVYANYGDADKELTWLRCGYRGVLDCDSQGVGNGCFFHFV